MKPYGDSKSNGTVPSESSKFNKASYSLQNDDIEEINRRVFTRQLAQELQGLHDLFSSLNQHLTKESEISDQLIRSYASISSTSMPQSLLDLSRYISKEDMWIHSMSSETRKVSIEFLRNLLEFQTSQKQSYQNQIRRLREVCNQATRNAIQMEREEWNHKLQSLQRREIEVAEDFQKKHDEELHRHKQQVNQLLHNIEELKDELREVSFKAQKETAAQGNYIKQTMEEQKREFAAEFKEMTKAALVDSNVLKSQFELQLHVVETNYKNLIKEIKSTDEQALDAIKKENQGLLDANQKLKHQVLTLQHEIDTLKTTYEAKLSEQRDTSDKILREQLSQSLQAQSALKAELAQAIQRYEQDDNVRKTDYQTKLDNLRETLKKQHLMEMEQMKDSHRNEMRKLQIDLTASYEDNISRLKHIHEQELNRLLRESQRSQNLFARYQNKGPKYADGNVDGRTTYAAKFTSNKLTEKSDVPDTFPLEEAFAGISAKDRQDISNISTNSRRVSSYLRELDKYISGEQEGTTLSIDQASGSSSKEEVDQSWNSRKPLVDISDSFSN